jgi:ATP-dependent DNA helicase RecG
MQSGTPFELKIADLARDGQLLEIARQIAIDILEEDPILEQEKNNLLKMQLRKMRNKKFNWSVIS